ncbi:unnamed protein product [Knipowitschia caucasica]|uniref:Golgin subfamily A member 1 n=1 Tax=Knipowitschia caucasica TaxID=637954 RepID=A0AAV2MT27_KNICA
MFAKLKKKIAEEAATAPRTGVRIPRTISRESITSVGADSGDDFASDSSSSRDDLPAQLQRRNNQIRRLEAKLSDYAEQLRLLQKTKDKLEIALESHQDSSIKKMQDQNESYVASRAKMAEGMTLALEKKDQEWMAKLEAVEKEKAALSSQLTEMTEQSLALFQKRDDHDELEGFQQQELAKVKHMLLRREEQVSRQEQELQHKEAEVQSMRRELQRLQEEHEESSRLNSELHIEREELLLFREESEKKILDLETQCEELQAVIKQVSEDFQQSQNTVMTLEKSLQELQTDYDARSLQQQKAAVTEEEKERTLLELQKKVTSLERRLQGNLTQDEHLQELLQEKTSLEQNMEETRAELLAARTNHADTVSSLEAQVSRMSSTISELQTLLRHKDESSRAYRERTDAQISSLDQQLSESNERLKSSERQMEEQEQSTEKLRGEWGTEKAFLDQQLSLLEKQSQEKCRRLEENVSTLQTDNQRLQDSLGDLEKRKQEDECALRRGGEELEKYKGDLSSQHRICTEITKALEDTRRQKEELQTRVAEFTASLVSHQHELTSATETLQQKDDQIKVLQKEVQSGLESLQQLRDESEKHRTETRQSEEEKEKELWSLKEELRGQTQQLDTSQARISFLEVEVETLTEQQQQHLEVCEEEQNGSVTVHDLDHMQKINRDLEQLLGEKNRTIKQLQQRLAELKRTLQKELKLKPESDADVRETRADKQERISPDPPTTSSPGPLTSTTTVTNTSDLNDSREINFEYLKHVVLKFMSCKEAEAFHLIRAVSVLLNFTREEEDLLKQTLEYKMSWFGSKPSPKGIIRPSISGSSSHWS